VYPENGIPFFNQNHCAAKRWRVACTYRFVSELNTSGILRNFLVFRTIRSCEKTMKKYLLLVLVCIALLLIAVPASASPTMTFTGPTGCVNPGDSLMYNVRYAEDWQNPGDWDLWFNWDPTLMNYGSYSSNQCPRPVVSSGQVYCGMADFFGSGTLTLTVKDGTPAGTSLPVRMKGNNYGENGGSVLNRNWDLKTCPVNPVPEFPTGFVSAGFIAGLLGVVLYLRREGNI
jgi:hypothetical protein